MGFRCSFAVSQTEPPALLNALGFRVASEAAEMPEAGRWCARLGSGWTVIFAHDLDLPYETQDEIAKLSRDSVQYLGMLSETTMSISVSKYSNGKEDWAIDWAGEEGFQLNRLSAQGNLPELFETLKRDAFEAQSIDQSVDHVFDIPVLLLKNETGFRYDDWLKTDDVDAFRVVTSTT